jgi:ubiquinone/menaquinone biosynthesis C-methylase UbiE
MTHPQPDRQHWEALPREFSVSSLDWQGILADLKTRAYARLINEWLGEKKVRLCLLTDLYEAAMDSTPLLPILQEKADSIIGMDISLATAQMARQNVHLRPGDSIIVADIQAPPFASQTFALIFSPSTLDHFKDKSAFSKSLDGLLRIAKRGAWLLLTLDNPHNITDPLLRLLSFFGFLPFYVGKTYRRRTLVQKLLKKGWCPEKIKTIIHHPRMMGVLLAKIGQAVRKAWFTKFMQDFLQRWQTFDGTRWQFLTGCFLAVLAGKKPEGCD